MYRTGLLVVPALLHQLPRSITPLFSAANQCIRDVLYVFLHPGTSERATQEYSSDILASIIKAYEGGALCSNLDLRVVLANTGVKSYQKLQHLKHKPEIMIVDRSLLRQGRLSDLVQEYCGIEKDMKVLDVSTDNVDFEHGTSSSGVSEKFYKSICLGGTFDHLHNGHKVMLSQACLASYQKVTVGVTASEMHKNKVLVELMQTTKERIEAVEEFLNDVKPDIECEVVRITDPYGPTIHTPDMDCLVVSQETLPGGRSVNEKRAAKGYAAMDLKVIDLVEDVCRASNEESKLSSTSYRKRLLAKLIKNSTTKTHLPHLPCVIGLTGGIASGKSSICKRLESLGAAVIDCDKLGHKAYENDSETFQKIVQHFGKDILSNTGDIERRKLGALVFAAPERRKELESIVWPRIRQKTVEGINTYRKKGIQVVILDAAVLLEAGWDDMVHEVWVATLPVNEAVRRVQSRNALTEEEARRRVDAQLSNQERISHANVVLSTQWEPEVTQKQVEKAWKLLQERLVNDGK